MTTDDWPAGLGAPATRALRGAGFHRLADLDGVSHRTLAALHGVGPKALHILTAALTERGLGLTP